jgi:2'-5' RNA ligase superfamily
MPAELCASTVPFSDLAPAVDDWRERTCATKPSHGVPPHVTLLIPAPPEVDGAAEALGSFGAFDVIFARLGRFPGTLWLAPEPAEPLVEMTRSLLTRFPGHEPYGGEFAEITPHLTVAQGEELSTAGAALEPLLPLNSRASSVVLFEQVAPDRWRENAELAL